MLKLICNKEECGNKDIVYYMPEVTNPSMCGGCKQGIVPIEMSQAEYDDVFDYDPFAIIPMNGGI
jgi:hypothetical protein